MTIILAAPQKTKTFLGSYLKYIFLHSKICNLAQPCAIGLAVEVFLKAHQVKFLCCTMNTYNSFIHIISF